MAVRLPGGGYIAETPEGRFAVYDFYNTGGPQSGAVIAFDLAGVDFQAAGFPTIHLNSTQWNAMRVTKGGSANELGTFNHTKWGGGAAFQDFIDEQIDKLFPDMDIRGNPELLSVLFQYVGSPDMSEDQLEELVRRTDWWKGRTDLQREWTGLSPGEKTFRVNQQVTELSRLWMTYLGTPGDPYDSELRELAEKVASGEIGQGWVIEMVLKPRAQQNPESPWSRQVREEQESQRRRPVEVENRATQVRQLGMRWGVQMTSGEINRWANELTTLLKSDDDLINYLKSAAQQLYPWKDPELETETAAQPWLASYERILGKPGTLFNKHIAQALHNSQSPPDFETYLRSLDEWVGTEDFDQITTQAATDFGRRAGFI